MTDRKRMLSLTVALVLGFGTFVADQLDITDCQGKELFQLENKLFSWRSTVMGMDGQGNVLFEVKKRNFTCTSAPISACYVVDEQGRLRVRSARIIQLTPQSE